MGKRKHNFQIKLFPRIAFNLVIDGLKNISEHNNCKQLPGISTKCKDMFWAEAGETPLVLLHIRTLPSLYGQLWDSRVPRGKLSMTQLVRINYGDTEKYQWLQKKKVQRIMIFSTAEYKSFGK